MLKYKIFDVRSTWPWSGQNIYVKIYMSKYICQNIYVKLNMCIGFSRKVRCRVT